MKNGRNIAVIGAGQWGQNLIRNFHALDALYAICDSNEDIIKKNVSLYPQCRFFTSPEQLLNEADIQAVAIATPAESHAELVKLALKAGKDVFVEKPLSLSSSEGEEIQLLLKDRILMVGHLLWYHPAILKLKSLIESGELGRMQYLYSTRLNLGKIRREENILWSFAPHDISVILGLLGEMPDSIQAQGGNYLREQIADVTVSLLSFPSGVKAHIFVSWLHPFKEQKLVVVGDKQMAVFDDLVKDKLVLYPHSIHWKGNQPIPNKAEAKIIILDSIEPLYAECSHFLDCVRDRKPPRTDLQEGLRVLKVLEQCQSALEGVKQPEKPKFSSESSPYFVHHSASIDSNVEIGEGTSVWHYTHILKGSKIGKKCSIGQNVMIGPQANVGNGVKIQNNVSIYEGVTLEDFVFCGPSMVFTNVLHPRSEISRRHEFLPTLVKRGATLGANCTILCGTTIGSYAFIGAGAVVTKDVPDYALVVGNPARVVGWSCRCGFKLKQTFENPPTFHCSCGDSYKKDSEGNLKPAISQEVLS
jgi:UDP-2-acetamido-3-amino-2,3-dideoxy-glucuronate N-acetyltransferase